MNRAIYRIGPAGLCVIALAATPARAEDATTVSEITISATRLPQPLDVIPGAYVIDEVEISDRQAVFAGDVLATVPGLSVFNAGAFGGVTSVRQRGASSDKTLVLIDGVPVNDASQPAGGFDFSAIDLADIQRVEVLSGPQSSLWGSDAIGGVIAFTTREPDGARAGVEGGSFGTARLSAALGRSTEKWALGFSAANFSTTGISVADVRNGNTEPDGLHDLTLSARGRLNLSDAVQVDGQLRYNNSHTDVDGYPARTGFTLADTDDVAKSRSVEGFVRAKAEGPFASHNEFIIGRYQIARSQSGESGPFAYTASRDVYRWTAARGGIADPFSVMIGAERDNTHASLSDASQASLGETAAFAVVR